MQPERLKSASLTASLRAYAHGFVPVHWICWLDMAQFACWFHSHLRPSSTKRIESPMLVVAVEEKRMDMTVVIGQDTLPSEEGSNGGACQRLMEG